MVTAVVKICPTRILGLSIDSNKKEREENMTAGANFICLSLGTGKVTLGANDRVSGYTYPSRIPAFYTQRRITEYARK